MKMDKEEVFERLHQHGYRLTEPRRTLVSMILENRHWVNAQALYEATKAAGLKIGRATVYRTIDLLSELGYIVRVHGPDDCHSHALHNPYEHQHQLICTGCGATMLVRSCELERAEAALASQTGFTITGHLLQFYGKCPQCAGAQSQRLSQA